LLEVPLELVEGRPLVWIGGSEELQLRQTTARATKVEAEHAAEASEDGDGKRVVRQSDVAEARNQGFQFRLGDAPGHRDRWILDCESFADLHSLRAA